MAHGENADNRKNGREYWSRRAGIQSWGKIGKQITHEKERMMKKKIEHDAMKQNTASSEEST